MDVGAIDASHEFNATFRSALAKTRSLLRGAQLEATSRANNLFGAVDVLLDAEEDLTALVHFCQLWPARRLCAQPQCGRFPQVVQRVCFGLTLDPLLSTVFLGWLLDLCTARVCLGPSLISFVFHVAESFYAGLPVTSDERVADAALALCLASRRLCTPVAHASERCDAGPATLKKIK